MALLLQPYDKRLVKTIKMNFRELIAEVGVAPRQVRYMIAEGFVPAPTGGRAHASYGEAHVRAICRYKRLRALGFPPGAIRVLQQAKVGVPFPVAPGITLVVDRELIASGVPNEALARQVQARLQEILSTNEERS